MNNVIDDVSRIDEEIRQLTCDKGQANTDRRLYEEWFVLRSTLKGNDVIQPWHGVLSCPCTVHI